MFVHEPLAALGNEMGSPLDVETACPFLAVSHDALPGPVAEQLIGPVPKGPFPVWREAMAFFMALEASTFWYTTELFVPCMFLPSERGVTTITAIERNARSRAVTDIRRRNRE